MRAVYEPPLPERTAEQMASRKGAKDAKNLRELLLNLGDKWRIEGLRIEGIGEMMISDLKKEGRDQGGASFAALPKQGYTGAVCVSSWPFLRRKCGNPMKIQGHEARAHRRSQVGGDGEWDGAISRALRFDGRLQRVKNHTSSWCPL